ncbi:DUF3304 domain-containing protein [Xanthomonas massiliensis]|uniref:DUF3304 domain-containing protein n=1 Tax=Xanthomonas massiliensis TaxID=1720302 RepID=UPI0013664BFA|nr:DUF3304 domain-containing protein [Xanthomonas massiliensis]
MKSVLVAIGVVVLLAMMGGAGCAVAKGRDKPKYLTLFAYNYTDRGILNVRVDGIWMGGVSAYTNGKSAMGPRPPSNRKRQHTIKVDWEISASYYDLKTNKYVDDGQLVRKQAVVPLKFPYPSDPNMLLLHFYPDGHVEAELVGKQQNHWKMRRFPIPEGHKAHGRN